jgi:hypothetical protein
VEIFVDISADIPLNEGKHKRVYPAVPFLLSICVYSYNMDLLFVCLFGFFRQGLVI